MDPPYAETFSSYSKDSFKKEDQIKLKESFDDLTKRGVKVMESNSSCPFILDLYKDYKIIKVAVKRPINSKSTKRKDEVQEVLIVNY
jgi:DNA adenine methylase